MTSEYNSRSGDRGARDARDDSLSPLTTRVKEARKVHGLMAELVCHMVELHLTREEFDECIGELNEVLNTYRPFNRRERAAR